jgi:hypothetical protein
MKYATLLFLILFIPSSSFSQQLDKAIQSAAKDIARKVSKKNRIHLALADFLNNAGKYDPLTKYITEQTEIELINSDYGLQLIDRKHIKQLLDEHHLQSQGLIDESTAKSAISFIKVDGWVVGEITSLGESIKISIKIIDITTSEILAASTTDYISDPVAKKIMEAAEQQNEPKNKECSEKNLGDYCFSNNSSFAKTYSSTASVKLCYGNNCQTIIVSPGESQCVYNMPCGIYTYYILFDKLGPSLPRPTYSGAATYQYTGQIKVEQCKSKNYIIR